MAKHVSLTEPIIYEGEIGIGSAKLIFNKSLTPSVSTVSGTSKENERVYLVDFVLPEKAKDFEIKFM